MEKGKFIVFEGTDGSGKSTQLNLFLEYLDSKGVKYKTFDFPQYEQFWGRLVGRYLAGEFGGIEEISPYIVTPYYTLDQASRNKEIKEYLAQGYWVISNRYVSSSMAHQSAKFDNLEEAETFLQWFGQLCRQLEIVKDDLTLVLYADPSITYKQAQQALSRKKYTHGSMDIAEKSFDHQIKSARQYQSLSEAIPSWNLVDCMKSEKMDSVENIQQKIRGIVEREFGI